jgi:hypothetical protein
VGFKYNVELVPDNNYGALNLSTGQWNGLVKVKINQYQCCGTGFGIRWLFDPWIWDPEWVKNQDPDPG